jgi:hypothetical protein
MIWVPTVNYSILGCGKNFTIILEEPAASIFRVDGEDEVRIFLPHTDNYLPNYTGL